MPTRITSHDGPDPVDVHVGRTIRELRHLRGLSQTALAEELGVTFQQIQKYENSTNRVSASKLYAIAGVLGVGVERFFEGVGKTAAPEDPGTLALVRAYRRIKDQPLRDSALTTVRVLAKASEAA